MQLIKTERLTVRQKDEIGRLITVCRAFCPIQLNFPFEDGSVFHLAYEKEASGSVLTSALALIIPDSYDSDETIECLAFTHPAYRRKGCFSALFEAAADDIEDTDLLFPTDGQDPAVLPVLEALGAEYDFCEHKMELELSAAEFPPSPYRSDIPGRRLICHTENCSDGSVLYSFFPAEKESHPAAVCRTVSFGAHVCFYGFQVEEKLRGQGFGKEALLTVIKLLGGQGFKTLFLHVSGENAAALGLYKKTGFRITETLSYYLY